MRSVLRTALSIPILLAEVSVARAEGISLRLPLACEPGHTCFVQHYVDHDPSPGIRDYACGSQTNDGHDGTDFRPPTRAAEAREVGTVLAAASGRVLRTRNDVPDVSVRETGRAAVAGVECGNGLVIAHAGGYETQYCHLARDSLRVRSGDVVAAGQPIGQAGLSGATEFPHLHFTVRQHGKVVDPFAPGATTGACDAEAKLVSALWDEVARGRLVYRAGTVLNSGFAGGPVSMDAVEAEATEAAGPNADALVAWVRAIGLAPGDVQQLNLTGPDGKVIIERQEPPLVRPRAQSLLYAGKKRPPEGWLPGTYTATFKVMRSGSAAIEHTFTAMLPTQVP
ncbi:M23 family metallopeptidase [Methylobacterium nodulans]|uniref:Peptidase M23 n=1 Tax=Methylobacterium nodulans (strain LMG 21967 / CNCM I-2342 / ORS 2060) TaxID=460265 RepID=B8IWS9_METNO|nr:M23 family metallopeptidase [Methylobacterium nodulans]ACL62970.1 Peptidase M23 [Methylobacterium nodulans ORS 2060]